MYTMPEENREVMVESLRKTFLQVGTFDSAAANKLRQRPQQPLMGRVPSAAEISAARTKPGAGKSAGDVECPGEFWKGAAEYRTINALIFWWGCTGLIDFRNSVEAGPRSKELEALEASTDMPTQSSCSSK